MGDTPPPSPLAPTPPPVPAAHSGGDVALGVFICLAANLSMSLGTNILKLSFSKRSQRAEELRLAAVAAGDAAAAPKLPPVYTDKFWLVRPRQRRPAAAGARPSCASRHPNARTPRLASSCTRLAT